MGSLSQVVTSFSGISRGRVGIMGLLALVVSGLIFTSFTVLNRPVRENLYSNLDAEDVNRIGSVLSEVGISFDVNEAGSAVMVEHGKAAQARMILASKGLPKSDKAGYELFDQMGSLGLTSFMQQVTRVRALEGELVRTIQLLDGIKAARVHLALKAEGAFRSKDEKPSAAVVIRAEGSPTESTASAIRQIVAAAIPGLTTEHVSVTTTDGILMSSVGEQESAEPTRMMDLESKISRETQDRIERTLAPVTGLSNLRVSVAAQLDLDKRQITETDYDPESKVERSTRVVKSSDQSNDSNASRSVSADQNIPREVQSNTGGDSNSKKKESKEELVNYEVNSKQTATTSSGYRVQKLSVAVVINRKVFDTADGTAPDDGKLKERLTEIEMLVKSASGFDEGRKDTVKVALIDFVKDGGDIEPLAGPGLLDAIQGNLGTIVNAFSLIIAILLVIVLGLRPALRMMLEKGSVGSQSTPQPQQLANVQSHVALPNSLNVSQTESMDAASAVPIDKLNRIVGIDMDRAAQVLKQWLDKPLKEAA